MMRRQWSQAWAVLLLAGIGTATILLLSCGKPEPATKPKAPDVPTAGNVTGKKPDWERVRGRWLRPDAGYTLEIRKVATDGKLDAAYFMPAAVALTNAVAKLEGATIKVFIQLNDVNYAGCTYTLTYDAQADRLNGVYYQAALREKYDIFFIRLQ